MSTGYYLFKVRYIFPANWMATVSGERFSGFFQLIPPPPLSWRNVLYCRLYRASFQNVFYLWKTVTNFSTPFYFVWVLINRLKIVLLIYSFGPTYFPKISIIRLSQYMYLQSLLRYSFRPTYFLRYPLSICHNIYVFTVFAKIFIRTHIFPKISIIRLSQYIYSLTVAAKGL